MDCTQDFIDQVRSVYICLLTWTVHWILLIKWGRFTSAYWHGLYTVMYWSGEVSLHVFIDMDCTQECIDQERSVYMRLLTWAVQGMYWSGEVSLHAFIDMGCTRNVLIKGGQFTCVYWHGLYKECIDQRRSVYMCLLTWTVHSNVLIKGGQFTCAYWQALYGSMTVTLCFISHRFGKSGRLSWRLSAPRAR